MPDLLTLKVQWPLALLLLILPGCVLALGMRRRARGDPLTLPVLSLWVVGMAGLALACARPSAEWIQSVPLDRLVIAIDSSGSMRADDVPPSRIDQARAIARQLIDAMPSTAMIGLVGMSANAALVQAPTRRKEELHHALDRLALQPGSALGSGLAMGLAHLLPEARIDVELLTGGVSRRSWASGAQADGATPSPFGTPDPPVEVGSRKDAVLVVLADGESNVGPAPAKIADIARLWGVRIYAVGVGTARGAVLRAEGVAARVRLEEQTLRDIAAISGGEYYALADTGTLGRIFSSLSGRIGLERRQRSEITGWVSLFGALLLGAGALLSVARRGRIL